MKKTNELPTITCQRCGHRWIKRVDRPLKCPNCQTKLK